MEEGMLEASDAIVHAHEDVLEEGGFAGFVRRGEDNQWEFHRTLATLDEPMLQTTMGEMLERDPSLEQLALLPTNHQAWRWEPGDGFETGRIPLGPTYFLEVEAVPNPDHPDVDQIAGAVVACWIRVPLESEALAIAKSVIRGSGFRIEEIEGPEEHSLEDYQDDSEGIEFFEQAQTDGEVFLFQEYEVGD